MTNWDKLHMEVDSDLEADDITDAEAKQYHDYFFRTAMISAWRAELTKEQALSGLCIALIKNQIENNKSELEKTMQLTFPRTMILPID